MSKYLPWVSCAFDNLSNKLAVWLPLAIRMIHYIIGSMLATIISSLIRDSISWECKVTEEINGCIVHCPGGAHI